MDIFGDVIENRQRKTTKSSAGFKISGANLETEEASKNNLQKKKEERFTSTIQKQRNWW